jgi:pimeloyl-ACP methyl ester carboxylesterase
MEKKYKKFPVVILPGWLLSGDFYKELAEKLRQEGFAVYTIDFPGFNDRFLSRVLNLTDYVKYLNKFLRSHKLDRVIFIGHSFGGRVALKYISQNNKIAKALILSGTPGFPEVANWRLIASRFLAKLGKPVSYIPPFLFFRSKIRRLFYRLNRSGDYLKISGELKKTFQNIIKEHLINYMEKIRVPTLLLWGEKDRLVSVKTARKMHKKIAKSRIEILPQMGHMFIYKNPDKAVSSIIKFLNSIN